MTEKQQVYLPFAQRAWALAVISILLQSGALLGVWEPLEAPAERLWIGLIEVLLMLLLLINSWASFWALRRQSAGPGIRWCALLSALSLLLCFGGDVINRNFTGDFYHYDDVIKHSYLVNSVAFFAPGYLLYIGMVAWISRSRVTTSLLKQTTILALLIGFAGFVSMANWEASAIVLGVTGGYAALITVMVAVSYWILRWLGGSAWWVAFGAALAALADALIGQFWIYGDGYFPTISHINWMVYFSSQVLIQQLVWKFWLLSDD